MRRAITIATWCILVALYTIPVSADSPHYIKLSATFDPSTACYNVDLKEAGLGNSGLTSVTYDLSATATFTAVCVTKNGKNEVQGQPKSGTGDATEPTTIQIRNGQTNGTVSLCPQAFTLPDPGCTGSQTLVITGATYTNVTLSDNLTPGAGDQGLPSLGPSSGLHVIP